MIENKYQLFGNGCFSAVFKMNDKLCKITKQCEYENMSNAASILNYLSDCGYNVAKHYKVIDLGEVGEEYFDAISSINGLLNTEYLQQAQKLKGNPVKLCAIIQDYVEGEQIFDDIFYHLIYMNRRGVNNTWSVIYDYYNIKEDKSEELFKTELENNYLKKLQHMINIPDQMYLDFVYTMKKLSESGVVVDIKNSNYIFNEQGFFPIDFDGYLSKQGDYLHASLDKVLEICEMPIRTPKCVEAKLSLSAKIYSIAQNLQYDESIDINILKHHIYRSYGTARRELSLIQNKQLKQYYEDLFINKKLTKYKPIVIEEIQM